jgi:hypothetical protein
MAVVPFPAAAEPSKRKVEIFCVQSYWRDRKGLAKGRFQQFAAQEPALRAAQAAAVRAAGVTVYVMRGYVGTDTWDRPVVVAKLGEVPRLEA